MNERSSPLDTSTLWCVVANVVDAHAWGPGGAVIRHGTRLLRAGAKVWMVGYYWGDVPPEVMVIGQHRASRKFILSVVGLDRLTSWRVQGVYHPRVIEFARAIMRPAAVRGAAVGVFADRAPADELLARLPR